MTFRHTEQVAIGRCIHLIKRHHITNKKIQGFIKKKETISTLISSPLLHIRKYYLRYPMPIYQTTFERINLSVTSIPREIFRHFQLNETPFQIPWKKK